MISTGPSRDLARQWNLIITGQERAAPMSVLRYLIRAAFTTGRLEAVNLIAGQLAVSLDNARLYADHRRNAAGEQAALRRVATLVARAAAPREVFAAVAEVASALIGLLLLLASVLLLRTNRDLLSGRGVPSPMLREMSQVISEQAGVVDVPDLFAIVIGPSSLVVDGDVTFADALDVPAVEQAILHCIHVLRERWPLIKYVYLTPVGKARPTRAARSGGHDQDPGQLPGPLHGG